MKIVVHLVTWSRLVGLWLLVSSCSQFFTTSFPQAPQRERTGVFDQAYLIVWASTERVLRGKQAFPVLVDREAGLIRVALPDGTSVTAFVEPVDLNRTKVYVSRNRGARTAVSELAILDEIGADIRAVPR